LTSFFVERTGQDRKKANLVFMTAAIGAILGARILYFIASAPGEFSIANFFKFQEGGLVAYGGFVGGVGAGVAMALRLRADWLGLGDCVAPALALGTGITRHGCFLYGCDFGRVTESAWALHFPRWSNPGVAHWIPGGSPAFNQHFTGHVHQSVEVMSMGVHPTQLLSSVNGFLAFVVLMLVIPYRQFKGQVLLSFLMYYGLTRFLIEILRGDAIRGTSTLGLPLSTSQFVSICIWALGIPLWVWLYRREKNKSSVA
jgi:phosphatidylglycerol---prolipoprotein diacylglyceryl transferase